MTAGMPLAGPYPITWGEYLSVVIKARVRAIRDTMKGRWSR